MTASQSSAACIPTTGLASPTDTHDTELCLDGAGAATIALQQPTFPIRAAFYYPWFPEAWNQQGFNPFTNYNPTLGFYDSSDTATIDAQVAELQYAGLNAAIVSWWGQGTPTDGRVSTFLSRLQGTNLFATLYYEAEGTSDPTSAQITSDLNYIASNYGSDPHVLHVGSKPVIFVYSANDTTCAIADRWAAANAAATTPFYVVLKVFPGYASCTNQPDNWHQYGPASASNHQAGHSFAISPGFWKQGCPQLNGGTCTQGGTVPYLARQPDVFGTNCAAMVASNEPWQLVTTFNEWGEGTAFESATQWTSDSGYGMYSDVLHHCIVDPNGPPPSTTTTTSTSTSTTPTSTTSSTTTTMAPTSTTTTTTVPTTTTTTTMTTTTTTTTTTTVPTTTTTVPTRPRTPDGYWMVTSTGSVFSFGQVSNWGNVRTVPVTHFEPTPSKLGYWIVNAAGQAFAFGDAKWYGNGGTLQRGETVSSLSRTADGNGYWLFTSRGRVFPRGDARSHGDLSKLLLNGPIVGSVATPTGNGYYMVGSDGGIFCFGDAVFRGSMGGAHLNKPVEALVPTADNRGYWLVASDGGIFAFGDAPFRGSMGATHLAKPVVGMVRYGNGYLMAGSDGGVFDFSSLPFLGSLANNPPAAPVVSIAA